MADAAPAPVRQRPDWTSDVLTYSASYTVDVTYRCAKRCGYCEYRSDSGGLIAWEAIDAQLDEAARLGGREVLVMTCSCATRPPSSTASSRSAAAPWLAGCCPTSTSGC
jgi:2-iminoacetate synthase ThiH